MGGSSASITVTVSTSQKVLHTHAPIPTYVGTSSVQPRFERSPQVANHHRSKLSALPHEGTEEFELT